MVRSGFPDHIARRLDELISRFPAARTDQGVLIALSGGPDSVALLLAARPWARKRNRPLEAAHFNHNLRGTASDGDARFCRDLCRQLDLKLHEDAGDPRPLARRRGKGLEDAARSLRRDFFARTLRDNPQLSWVATAHHRDDQTETVLMRLLRGTGPDGMAGIRPISGHTLHPMLAVPRAQILEYLQAAGQPWRTDATNLDGGNTRSRLRRELLPVIRGIFGEGAEAAPARLATLWETDLDFLEAETAKALEATLDPRTGSLDVPALLALPPAVARRLLVRWLQDSGAVPADRLQAVHVLNILDWLRSGTSGQRLDLPGTGCLLRDFDQLRFQRDEVHPPMRNAADYRILVARNAPPQDPVAHGRQEGPGAVNEHGGWNLTCPADVLQGNLRVRNWRQGDRLRPLGLDGSRKLSDLFRESRLPAADRPGVLVVEDDTGILWAVGLARSERTRLLPRSQALVTISVVPRGEPQENAR
ncbi:tRNA lysidine(34) synthetase TilS [bacterium DOLJORAL78_65_58]|nr:MAG: tRNA lysidine(34) synthetase TilS [bacterium DOLZORAL124_64_63]PIE76032.1 MAG: tRNA lysidine(34) synthetase TilS [bacterium DOLJORAL78_65_58]